MAKKIIISIVMLILLAGSACGIYFGIQYYNIKDSAQYEDSTGTVELVNELRDKIVDLNTEIARLNNEILELTSSNNSKDEQISSLQESKNSLEQQVASLTETNNSNVEIISQNEQTISALEKQISALESTVEDNTNEISQLNGTITSLKNINQQLQNINENNSITISTLNNQLTSLNAQINDLLGQVSNNSNVVSSLNAKIQELEKSVAYYEEYIAGLETGTQVVATFEFDGSVYSIQILDKNGCASVTNPTSTDYVIFNYWTVNGEQVDLSTYQVTTNTKFVANVTYKYDVKFLVNNEEYDSQIVVENGFAELPDTPVIDNFIFNYWTLDGVNEVDVNSYAITQNTTFIAKISLNVFNVTFMVDGEIYGDIQTVLNGNIVDIPENPVISGKDFAYWTLDGVNKVDLLTYTITENTTFIARFKEYQVITSSSYGLYTSDDKYLVEEGLFEIQIDGLKVGDDYRAKLQGPCFFTTPTNNYLNRANEYRFLATSRGSSSYKMVSGGSGYVYSFYLENGQSKIFTGTNNKGTKFTITLTVNCFEDGILSVAYSITPETVPYSSYLGYDMEYVKFHYTFLDSVEIYR